MLVLLFDRFVVSLVSWLPRCFDKLSNLWQPYKPYHLLMTIFCVLTSRPLMRRST